MATENQNQSNSIAIPDVLSPTFKEEMDVHIAAAMARAEGHPVQVPRVNVTVAASVVEGSSQKLAVHRLAFISRFGPGAGAILDRMIPLARGALAADIEQQRWESSGSLRDLHQVVIDKRDIVWNGLEGLVKRGLVREQVFASAQNVAGYDAITRSTDMLVTWANENWALVEEHTGLKKEDLLVARDAVQRLRLAETTRDQGVSTTPIDDLRDRAVIALARDYEEVRRMTTYLRWYQGDADELAPTLFQKDGETRDEAATQTTTTTNTTPVVLNPTDDGGPFTP
jgi:hypothetical protein